MKTGNQKTLASDNYAGALPEMIDAIASANNHHAGSYGHDEYTSRAVAAFKANFGEAAEVKFVFNGTAANVLSISTAVDNFSAILCADCSHMYVDESTAPETFTQCRLLPLKTDDQGKITISSIRERLIRKDDEHHPQPSVISITQPTEYGTLYSLTEIKAIAELAKSYGLYLHVDGARIFNAAAALNVGLDEMLTKTGVDIVSVGGTKLGMVFGEAVVILNKNLTKNVKFRHKKLMHLPSKNRFIACQFEALLKNRLWFNYADHANKMAKMLYEGLKELPEVSITKPVQANAVFAVIPKTWNEKLTTNKFFYVWNELTNEVRWMCAFDTTEEDIAEFITEAASLSMQGGG